MPRKFQRVVTIHGVNSTGQWQDDIAPVLAPHFEVVAIKYDDFDTLFKSVNVALDRWLFILALFVVGLTALRLCPLLIGVIAFLGIFFAAAIRSAFHRRRVVVAVKPYFSQYCRSGVPPHVIAHSFGTYLTARSFSFPDIRYGRVLLVGTVLPQRFDWQDVLNARGGKPVAQAVRNEVGKKDLVVLLAFFVSWIPKIKLGGAGLFGFRADSQIVHSATTPLGPCDECEERRRNGDTLAVVHNYPLREFRHSTHFLGTAHAEKLWLPFLWGIEPSELEDFYELAQTTCMLFAEGRLVELAVILEELHDRFYKWHNGDGCERAFENYVEDQVRLRFASYGLSTHEIADLAARAICVTCHAINEALIEREQGPEQQRFEILQALHPKIAVVKGVEGSGA